MRRSALPVNPWKVASIPSTRGAVVQVILQCAGEHRMRVAVGRGVEIAGQHHRHIVRQRRQVARDGLRALQARGFILVAVWQVGVEQVEAPAVAALFEQCPRHHAGMGVAP